MDPKALDRLLPRHEVAPMRATIEWDVRTERVKFKRKERSVEAVVVDLSLEGALIEAPLSSKHDKDDQVQIRLGGAEGGATIRHFRLGDNRDTWLYGVKWIHTPALREAVENGVEQLRENAAELRRSWEEQRR